MMPLSLRDRRWNDGKSNVRIIYKTFSKSHCNFNAWCDLKRKADVKHYCSKAAEKVRAALIIWLTGMLARLPGTGQRTLLVTKQPRMFVCKFKSKLFWKTTTSFGRNHVPQVQISLWFALPAELNWRNKEENNRVTFTVNAAGCIQGSCTLFKAFSRTFRAKFPQIQDPRQYSLRPGSRLITVTILRVFINRTGRFTEAYRQHKKKAWMCEHLCCVHINRIYKLQHYKIFPKHSQTFRGPVGTLCIFNKTELSAYQAKPQRSPGIRHKAAAVRNQEMKLHVSVNTSDETPTEYVLQ